MDYAFSYMAKYGIQTGNAYPYTARDGACKGAGTPAATLSGYTDVAQSETALAAASAVRVVSVAVDATNWGSYSTGIFAGNMCNANLNHGVTLVGYGTSKTGNDMTKWWIVKNSWGASWGE
jgi:KDEL-tailed cysteine endopeptidase